MLEVPNEIFWGGRAAFGFFFGWVGGTLSSAGAARTETVELGHDITCRDSFYARWWWHGGGRRWWSINTSGDGLLPFILGNFGPRRRGCEKCRGMLAQPGTKQTHLASARIRCYKERPEKELALSGRRCLISPGGQLPRHLNEARCSFLVKRERTNRRRTDPAAQTMAPTCRDKSGNPFWRPCSHDLSLSLTPLPIHGDEGIWHFVSDFFSLSQ